MSELVGAGLKDYEAVADLYDELAEYYRLRPFLLLKEDEAFKQVLNVLKGSVRTYKELEDCLENRLSLQMDEGKI